MKIESICRVFLWSGIALNKHKALLSWEQVCKPQKAGGLGIKKLKIWNMALLCKLIWAIEKEKESLWSIWINGYYLKGRSIWDVRCKPGVSWVWSSILKVLDMMKLVLASDLSFYSVMKGYNALCEPCKVPWWKAV